jgi:hypothetical protein
MLLSVIIVNYNSTRYLLPCLSSLFAETKGVDFETIVVDNASTDNGCDLVARTFPLVRLIKNEQNLGFAAANNKGFEISRGSSLLFLNPDTLIVGNAVAIALQELSRLPLAGAVGCELRNADSSIQTTAVLPFPTIANQIFGANALYRLFPQAKLWGNAPLFQGSEEAREVEAISGAGMFISRKAFVAAGMFDTRYFMYAEDIDLCYAIRKAGYKVYYTGKARITHYGGTSSGAGKFTILTMKESTYSMLTKWKGIRYADAYKAAFALSAAIRCSLLLVAAPFARVANRAERIEWSLAKWKTILLWAVRPKKAPKMREKVGHAWS